jgi:hypothetical protein
MCSLRGKFVMAFCSVLFVRLPWSVGKSRGRHTKRLPILGKLQDPYCHDLCSGNCLAQASAC